MTGDELLRAVAEILRADLRAVDVPVRYGGDEFAILLPDTGGRQALDLAERILSRLTRDPRLARYGVTGSFGLATHEYSHQESPLTLVERPTMPCTRPNGKAAIGSVCPRPTGTGRPLRDHHHGTGRHIRQLVGTAREMSAGPRRRET